MVLLDDQSPVKRKKARLSAPLHKEWAAPLSLLEDAVELKEKFYDGEHGAVGTLFGKDREGYVRKAYVDVFNIISNLIADKNANVYNENASQRELLVVIRGSSGVGKSTFLAYLLARLMGRKKNNLQNVAIFRAGKQAKRGDGSVKLDKVKYFVHVDGKTHKGQYGKVANDDSFEELLKKTELIIMDGCSMDFDLEDWCGVVIISASPSLYYKNQEDAIAFQKKILFPSLEREEALLMGKHLKVSSDIIKNNFLYMGGITRYLLCKNWAKESVDTACRHVNPKAIVAMVSSQGVSRDENHVIVHSLVLWSFKSNAAGLEKYFDEPVYSIVSRYAEVKVAQQLSEETTEDLRQTRKNLSQVSGAEGYAGALFEAYAIRKLQAGGTFSLRSLGKGANASKSKQILIKDLNKRDPVVIETNKLTKTSVPFDALCVVDEDSNTRLPCLLWPTTTNFPTFDCFFIDEAGHPFLLQMTIAKSHPLKYSGAINATNYFDEMLSNPILPTAYKAIFVVPEDIAGIFKEQPFTGPLPAGTSGIAVAERFEQWALGV